MSNEIEVLNEGGLVRGTNAPKFSLSSLNLADKCPAVVVASTGTKLAKYAFPKVKFEEGRRARLAILTEDVIMLKLHYHPEIGYIICDGKACCKHCDKVSIKYCYPVVMYDTDNAGRIVSPRVELKLLVLGGEMYDQISLLSEIGGSVTNMDLLFSCKSAQFQSCQVTQAGPATWTTNEHVVDYVSGYMSDNGQKILDAVGRSYTAEEFIAKLGDPNAPLVEPRQLTADDVTNMYKL